MSLRNTPARWGSLARTLHWTIALLIIALFIVGEIMGDLPGADRRLAYALHKSFGLLALALVLSRILWRMASPAPAALLTVPKLQRVAASLVHWGLYALMLAVPLSGWLVHSLSGYTTHWFGQDGLALLPSLPVAVATDRNAVEEIGELHGLLAWGIVILAAIHAGAALYHHFIRKDPILARMTPFIKEPH